MPSVEDLRREVALGRVVVVAGAGVSIAATRGAESASWVGLLRDGIAFCERSVADLPAGWGSRQREALNSRGDLYEVLSVAEQVSSRLGAPHSGLFGRWLRESVGSLKAVDRDLIETIAELKCPILTTNYDSLVETVSELQGVTHLDEAAVERIVRRDDRGVVHLHGSWLRPESVVLGIRSYDAVSGRSHSEAILRALAGVRTFLFIGCGLGLSDPHFGPLLSWVEATFSKSEYSHYMLVRAPDGRVSQPICQLSYGDSHDQLIDLVRSLCPRRRESRLSEAQFPRSRCLGRTEEVQQLVSNLTDSDSRPSVVLGGPGAGKSTIALSALTDRDVEAHFGGRRHFVRCDEINLTSALVQKVASQVGSTVEGLFDSLAAEPTALVLDNAEIPWEFDTQAFEELLVRLASVRGLQLVATVRGNQRPLGPDWRTPIVAMPLDREVITQLILSVAGSNFKDDPDLPKLVDETDGIPLVAVLLAHHAEAEPNLRSVLVRLQSERRRLLDRVGIQTRLSSVEVSFRLSLRSPRFTEEARRVLATLARMSLGFPHHALESVFPGFGRAGAAVLRKAGLIYDEGEEIRLLAPIREYFRTELEPDANDLRRAAVFDSERAEQLQGRRTRGQRRDRRSIILDAAELVFSRNGFHGTRIADVATEAGIAYGLIYHYFKNKQEIREEIVSERFSELDLGLPEDHLAGGGFERFVRSVFRFAERHPVFFRMTANDQFARDRFGQLLADKALSSLQQCVPAGGSPLLSSRVVADTILRSIEWWLEERNGEGRIPTETALALFPAWTLPRG